MSKKNLELETPISLPRKNAVGKRKQIVSDGGGSRVFSSGEFGPQGRKDKGVFKNQSERNGNHFYLTTPKRH